MKILPFKIPKSKHAALVVQTDVGNSFYKQLHQHLEIQISLIVKGEGTYVIGDKIGTFSADDLFVIGSNLPHVFMSDENPEQQVKMISLFFTYTSFGPHFFDLEEFRHLNYFFDDAKFGIKMEKKNDHLFKKMIEIKTRTVYQKFIDFLEILTLISEEKYKTLSTLINFQKYEGIQGKRMSNIFEFTMHNFDQNIQLQQVADVANMSRNAFCRYFKQRTNKTYFSFLTELRIEEASKILSKHSDLSINDVAIQCGFNNMAFFNRKFKEINHTTPSNFRKRHFKN